MFKHYKYLKYIIKHKWFVLFYGIKLKVPLWLLIIHDWSKFLPSEWFPYVNYFYIEGVCLEKLNTFNLAWLKHQNRQPHHWQYWLLTFDSGHTIPQQIPDKYVREMVADWCGAGRMWSKKLEVKEWYLVNKDKIQLHPATRLLVEKLIEELIEHVQ